MSVAVSVSVISVLPDMRFCLVFKLSVGSLIYNPYINIANVYDLQAFIDGSNVGGLHIVCLKSDVVTNIYM